MEPFYKLKNLLLLFVTALTDGKLACAGKQQYTKKLATSLYTRAEQN